MKITFYGHSCFGLQLPSVTGEKELNVLFDPFISPNPLASSIQVEHLPADYILLSHGHEDHMADAAEIARRTGAQIVSNFEIINWFEAVEKIENGHPMSLGGAWDFDFGRVKYVQATHSSSMPDGAYGGNPGGFVITGKEQRVYYAGDTGLHMDMKLIGEYMKPDIALLPIGDNFTMGAEDAAIASQFIQCSEIIGMHYDTFGFVEIDKEAAVRAFKKRGATLHLMDIGETRKF